LTIVGDLPLDGPLPTPQTEWVTTTQQLLQSVPRLMAGNNYCVLATSDANGAPWATPVFFAARNDRELFWVSASDSRHSRNIAARPGIAITIFDSSVGIGHAEALYLEAEAGECADVAAALDTLNGKLPSHQALETGDLVPAGPLTVYRAEILRRYVLIRGGNPDFDNVVDSRYEIP
jgi:uncharacterized protein YhbP (UPF0306 family)